MHCCLAVASAVVAPYGLVNICGFAAAATGGYPCMSPALKPRVAGCLTVSGPPLKGVRVLNSSLCGVMHGGVTLRRP